MTSNAGIIIYNVKHKEHGDHDVKLLTQVHMTRIWSSEGQPRAFPFLINILFSLMYFSKMLQHSYEVGRVGSISILWMEKLMWRDVFKMLLVNALLGFSWMESLNSEQFGPIVWEEGYASLGRKKTPTFIELLLYARQLETVAGIIYNLVESSNYYCGFSNFIFFIQNLREAVKLSHHHTDHP